MDVAGYGAFLDALEAMGLPASQHRCSSNDFSVIESQVEAFAAERVDLSYGVDGMPSTP